MAKNVVLKGFTTGLILQAAIGPVFVFILNTALQHGLMNGLSAVAGVTVVDYLYIILAIIGVGKLLEVKKIKFLFSILSSIVLIIFGILIFKSGLLSNSSSDFDMMQASLFSSFISTFILTFSSPLTIVFWASIFTNRTIEYSLNKRELVVFGLSAGAATFVFLGLTVSVFSFFNTMIPDMVLIVLNIAVGLILMGYGVIRIVKEIKPFTREK